MDPQLHKRFVNLATRMKWFEDNIYDVRQDKLAKEMSKFKSVFDISTGKFKPTEKAISELEIMMSNLERDYKPDDAFIFENRM
jgi:hypothetical protein